MRSSRYSGCLAAAAAGLLLVTSLASAQSRVAIPVGQNLRERPAQPGDVVLDIDGAGAYALDG